jgi:hypothetical protein
MSDDEKNSCFSQHDRADDGKCDKNRQSEQDLNEGCMVGKAYRGATGSTDSARPSGVMLCDADASIAIAMASFALAMTPNDEDEEEDALPEDDEQEEEEEEGEEEASASSLACAAACALADTGASAVSVVSVRSADCSPRGSGAVGKGKRATSSMPIDFRCSTVPSSGRRLVGGTNGGRWRVDQIERLLIKSIG